MLSDFTKVTFEGQVVPNICVGEAIHARILLILLAIYNLHQETYSLSYIRCTVYRTYTTILSLTQIEFIAMN